MDNAAKMELFRTLPSVDELMRKPELAALARLYGVALVTYSARAFLSRLRQEIAAGSLDVVSLRRALEGDTSEVERLARQSLQRSLRPVINATGVILHTNLGRAPLAREVTEDIREIAGGYTNLEFDIESGERGKRDSHTDWLFQAIFSEAGIEGVSTIAVNNNAAAVLLALNTLADGGEVIVSRGELVEIGGSFRIPDVMGKSGATLREVGTTNRTRIADYENAITDRTRLLLRVHRSNFEITGFTEQPSILDLAALARRRQLLLMEDLGSGALVDLRRFGINGEPSVFDSLRAGLDVVTYSGDKLLGGPQAGLLTGHADVIARMRSNSLFRALRVDKLTYAALEATLRAYVKQQHDSLPALRMMRFTKKEIGARVEAVIAAVKNEKIKLETVDGDSVVGGGAAPSSVLPTLLLAVTHVTLDAGKVAACLRSSDPPIVARVEGGRVLLDLRTVLPEQDRPIIVSLNQVT